MKLKELIDNVKVIKKIKYDKDLEIVNICCDSRKVKYGYLFFALTGFNTNGENYIFDAINSGAKVIILKNKDLSKFECFNVCFIVVDDVRKVMSLIASNFYFNAHKKLKIISVVGTNGKSSTTQILASILKFNGKRVGTIGTNEITIMNRKIKNNMTTPDPILLHKLFYQMVENKIEFCIIEVSAHAIFFNKLFGVKSESIIFTNFSQDHLDFFKTMEKYKKVKKSFFNKKNANFAIINIDDEVGREILRETDVKTYTYGIKNPSDVFAINISMKLNESEFVINYDDNVFFVKTNLTCLFNVYNILACFTCAKNLGISEYDIVSALYSIEQVSGRFNLADYGQNFNIIIDYAHTPESLKNLLSSVKQISKNKMITVFGCPGNRDELKREIMGEIAGKYSDFVILTTDNPQYENSIRIMRDIERGVIKTNCLYKLVDDRKKAISLAISLATPKSTIVLAGKGNETYQNINGKHIKYSDQDEVKRQLESIKKIKLESKFVY